MVRLIHFLLALLTSSVRTRLSLTLRPPTPLDDMQLARRFGMSRSPIREALNRLAHEHTRNLQDHFLRFIEVEFATAFRLDISQDLAKDHVP